MRTVIALFGLACLLFSQDPSRQKVQVSNTQRMHFPAGGVLHLKNSIGELTVEGWDQPDVEITTAKITQDFYNSRDREKASHELDLIIVTAKRQGDEVLVSTTYPKRRDFPLVSSFHIAAGVDVAYRVKVPFAARLMIEHGSGEVHVWNVTGDVHVTVRRGGISVGLPEDGQYSIDAKSHLGGVVSDFSGTTKHARWLLGRRFQKEGASAASKLYLRVGYGDVLLLKIPKRPASASTQ